MADTGRDRRRILLHVAGVLLLVVIAMQLIPYGWKHSNPPVTADAPWPTAEAEAIARRSCYSCHSNETSWPAYSYVAPMSWLVRRDVDRGRAELNFSTWGQGEDAPGEEIEDATDDAIDVIEDGEMPPGQYVLLHPDASLSEEDAQILIGALEEMAGTR